MYKLFPNHLDCAAVMHFSMMYLNKNCVSQMEILTRTINDTVSKVAENVMETKINPSIEKPIKYSLQVQLAYITKQLKQHDFLLP